MEYEQLLLEHNYSRRYVFLQVNENVVAFFMTMLFSTKKFAHPSKVTPNMHSL